MSPILRKVTKLRAGSTDAVPIFWNEAPEEAPNVAGRVLRVEEFGVFTLELGQPPGVFDYGLDPNRVYVDWIFVADDAERAVQNEHAAWAAINSQKSSTQVETGTLPDKDGTRHYARRRFTF